MEMLSYIKANYIIQGNFPTLDYNHDDHHQESSTDHNNNLHIVDYNPPLQQQQQQAASFYGSNSFDKLSFADVMQFADFGPKLGLNQTKSAEEETAYFLKLNDHKDDDEHQLDDQEENRFNGGPVGVGEGKGVKRKRGRSIKSIEEVESQRMTHIAVERNRRKQMNEHLRVLRSLMPTSYVQRVGNHASIYVWKNCTFSSI